MRLDINPYSPQPEFALAASLRNFNLVDTNDLLRRYVGFGVSSGEMDVFCEMETSNGYVKGYVKPLIRHINVVSLKRGTFSAETFRTALTAGAAAIFMNHRTKAVGTKVEFSGRLDEPQVSVWKTIRYFFHNAFVHRLTDKLEGNVPFKEIRKHARPSTGKPGF